MCAVTNEIRSFLADKHNSCLKLYVSCKILEVQQISVLMLNLILFMSVHTFHWGHRGVTVFKVLRYKSEGRWFDSRWCH
jgi:hypothetical protein